LAIAVAKELVVVVFVADVMIDPSVIIITLFIVIVCGHHFYGYVYDQFAERTINNKIQTILFDYILYNCLIYKHMV
jgi:hypothetical protein